MRITNREILGEPITLVKTSKFRILKPRIVKDESALLAANQFNIEGCTIPDSFGKEWGDQCVSQTLNSALTNHALANGDHRAFYEPFFRTPELNVSASFCYTAICCSTALANESLHAPQLR